jgi:hypothetical protein
VGESSLLYTLGALLSFINPYLSILVLIFIQLNYALAILPVLRERKKNTIVQQDE